MKALIKKFPEKGIHMEEMPSPICRDNEIKIKKVFIIPAIYKLADEMFVNSRDQWERLRRSKDNNTIQVSTIKISFDSENQMWTIYNNGNGIDIADHPSEKDENGKPINIVTLIFGYLLTSKNYKEKNKTVGGKNGYGAKLTNIFSKYFKVETVDHVRGLKFIQEWSDNMKQSTKPKITKVKCNM